MANEFLAGLIHFNLAAAGAVLVVLALRDTIRRRFGTEIAYRLWLLVPIVAVAALLPPTEATRIVPPGDGPHFDPIFAASQSVSHAPAGPVLWIWFAGVMLGVSLVAFCQMRFLRMARRGLAGPAVTGFVTPQIVMPAAARTLYSDEERVLIRAHERTHIDRGDPRTNGLIALAQCLFWFNPLVHVAAREARLDQELACDATVLRHRSGQKRLYAQTLLKTQIGAVATPLGCHWLAGAAPHPLEQRIQALRRPTPSFRSHDRGLLATAAVIALVAFVAWKAQPAALPEGMPPIYEPVELHHMQAIIVGTVYSIG